MGQEQVQPLLLPVLVAVLAPVLMHLHLVALMVVVVSCLLPLLPNLGALQEHQEEERMRRHSSSNNNNNSTQLLPLSQASCVVSASRVQMIA